MSLARADVVERAQFAGFQDHFQVRGAAGFFHRGDLVEDVVVIAGQEMPAADDHVDLVGAFADRVARVVELDVQRILARRENRSRRRRR